MSNRNQSHLLSSAAVCAALFLAACSGTTTSKLDTSTSTYGASLSTLKICSGYECPIQDKFTISKSEAKHIRKLMNDGQSATPKAERAALSKAVAYFETIAQRRLRYVPDVEFSFQRNARKRGQMDCIDESLNTIAFLRYLQNHDLLKHHKPIKTFAERGLLVDGRYPHKSARMRQNNGVDWAVDSWKGPNGAEPEIMPLKIWYKDRNSPSDYRA